MARDHPDTYVKYHRGLKALVRDTDDSTRMHRETQVVWLWGPTGVGKTRAAWEYTKEADLELFPKNDTKWWDGYTGQDVVLFDDFRAHHHDFAYLLRVFDRYDMIVESKGDSGKLTCSKFIVTTPKDIEDTYTGTTFADVEGIEQLHRRCTEVRVESWEQAKEAIKIAFS